MVKGSWKHCKKHRSYEAACYACRGLNGIKLAPLTRKKKAVESRCRWTDQLKGRCTKKLFHGGDHGYEWRYKDTHVVPEERIGARALFDNEPLAAACMEAALEHLGISERYQHAAALLRAPESEGD